MLQRDLRKVVDVIDRLGPIDDGNAGGFSSTAARHCSDMADLLCESTGLSRADTLHWLLHTARGNTLFLRSLGKRLERAKTKEAAMPQQSREEFMATVAKQYGAVAIAKHVLATGHTTNITEHEFVKACGPDFVKLYTDQGEDGLTMRKALDLIKNATWAAKAERGMPAAAPQVDHNVATLRPRVTGGRSATGAADGSRTSAYAELQSLAEEQRRRAPFMTPEQCFAAVYTATENIDLVNRERFEARSRMTSANPGWPS